MNDINIERYAETLSRVYKDYGDLFTLYKAAKDENDSLCLTMDKLKTYHHAEFDSLLTELEKTQDDKATLIEIIDDLKAQHRVEIDNLWGEIMSKEKTYKIGDTGPDGGVVFIVSEDGHHGVVSQIEDHNAMSWNMANKRFKGEDGCWRLPTKDELNALYLHKDAIGGFDNYNYWSSTESGFGYAWLQNFSIGIQASNDKGSAFNVRVVMEF